MALVIRSARTGKKGERKFRIVVKEKRSRRDGDNLELLGWYAKGKDGKKEINMERIKYWVSKGAKTSPAIENLLK
ncbi:MAG TPA: 30S ribosomal protein S16 [Patescibacteria group bacterium]|nr:30S ribosomal protein S16 [Patescibacteria group bacterium]